MTADRTVDPTNLRSTGPSHILSNGLRAAGVAALLLTTATPSFAAAATGPAVNTTPLAPIEGKNSDLGAIKGIVYYL